MAFLGLLTGLLHGQALLGNALEEARALYSHTRYQESLQAAARAPESVAAWFLKGLAYYQLDQHKEAVQAFEKALEAEPRNSTYANWLGKAWGRRAESASFLTAPSHARKARDYFEMAVKLDPHNLEAVSDLFDYYVSAPGFLGGGTDKAEKLIQPVRDLNPGEYSYFQARLAEKRKDAGAAEKYYRSAAAADPRKAGRLLDLAKFLFRTGRTSEAESVITQAKALEPHATRINFVLAQEYIRTGQNREEAVRLLEEYLKAPLTPDDPSRAEARKLLEKARRG